MRHSTHTSLLVVYMRTHAPWYNTLSLFMVQPTSLFVAYITKQSIHTIFVVYMTTHAPEYTHTSLFLYMTTHAP